MLLLAAHMVCVDGQVHDQELQILDGLAKRWGVSEGARVYARQIVEGSTDAMSLDAAFRAVPVQHRDVALRGLVAVALADRVLVGEERDLLSRAAREWGVAEADLDALVAQVQAELADLLAVTSDSPVRASFAARFVAGVDSVLGARATDAMGSLIGRGEGVERLRREFMLAGPEYDAAIADCAATSRGDLAVCQERLAVATAALDRLVVSLKRQSLQLSREAARGQASAAKEGVQLVEETATGIEEEARARLERLRRGLEAKERTVDSFTLAFMGRTKAGKSTLHAVLSSQGHDGIGEGKLRTTRFNRVYRWKNVRMVDTPGVGAPGGKGEVEIAESVIDEADLVCYVFTNDSQQLAELDFLIGLRKRAKSVVILLNVKQNLRSKTQLRRFLADPGRQFMKEGTRGVPGHVQRIHRYVRESFGGVQLDVVPVQLLAAQMAAEKEHSCDATDLRKGSGIDDFLSWLRVGIIEHGTMRRSQTILGCSGADVHQVRQWLAGRSENLEKSIGLIGQRKGDMLGRMEEAARSAEERQRVSIADAYRRVRNSAGPFAEDNWDSSQKDLDIAWKRNVKRFGLEMAVREAQELAAAEFQTQVSEALEEIGRELEALAGLQTPGGGVQQQIGGQGLHTFLKWAARALGCIGGFAVWVPGLQGVGVALMIIGSLFGGLKDWVFIGKQKRRRKAVNRISDTLLKGLVSAEEETQLAASEALQDSVNTFRRNVTAYFDAVIRGLKDASGSIQTARDEVAASVEALNHAFAKRVVDWGAGESALGLTITAVDRAPGEEMTIHVAGDWRPSPRWTEIDELLLERVRVIAIA